MSRAETLIKIADHAVASYETSSRSIGTLFDAAHQIVSGYQDSFQTTKRERETISAELRENLTKNESLRRVDFDRMMRGVFSAQEDRERQVREGLNQYLNDQRTMIHAFGDSLSRYKDALAKGEALRLQEFQSLIQEILARQDERKNEVTAQLKEFQRQQQELTRTLKELLAKGKELRIKDLKRMLEAFREQRQERLAGQGERRRDVQEMLHELLRDRSAGARDRQERMKRKTEIPLPDPASRTGRSAKDPNLRT